MEQRNFFIVVVLIFLFNGEILAQQKIVEKIPVSLNNYSHNTGFKPKDSCGAYLKKGAMREPKYAGTQLINPLVIWDSYSLNTMVIKDFYVKHLSFFCRKELQFEKATSIPFRFRLGSIQYTDYLEQKPNAKK